MHGLPSGYGPAPDREEAVRLIRYAVELGCTHFDTAEGYGRAHNELLVGEALRPVRDQAVIATKLRVNQGTSDNPIEKQVREHLEASLRRLGTDHVELYYLHRINPAVPVEDVAHPMGKLIREGKIRGWGQSQSTPDQNSPGVWHNPALSHSKRIFHHGADVREGSPSALSGVEHRFRRLLAACERISVRKGPAWRQIPGDDVRRVITRFDPENVRANQPLVEMLQRF